MNTEEEEETRARRGEDTSPGTAKCKISRGEDALWRRHTLSTPLSDPRGFASSLQLARLGSLHYRDRPDVALSWTISAALTQIHSCHQNGEWARERARASVLSTS